MNTWANNLVQDVRNEPGRFKALAGLTIFLTIFLCEYQFLVSPFFAYEGLNFYPPSLLGWVSLIAFGVLPVSFLPLVVKRPSDFLIIYLYIFLYIPSIFIPPLAIKDFAYQSYSLFLLISLWILVSLRGRVQFTWLRIRIDQRIFRSLLWTILGVTLLYINLYAKSKISFFSLLDVYDVRAEYKDSLSDAPLILSYMVGWSGNVIIPYFAIIYIQKHKWIMFLVVILCELVFFLRTGFKSLFFGFFLVLIIYVYLNWRKINIFSISIFLSIILFIGIIIDFGTSVPFLSSFMHRRTFAIPGLLAGYYYDFFGQHKFALLGHSIFKEFSNYPYQLPPPNLIAWFYFGKPEMSANAGIWSDAYANFGVIGMFSFSALASIVFGIYDQVWSRRGLAISCAMLGILGFSLANSAFLTTFATHGFALSILIGMMDSTIVSPGIRIKAEG